MCSVDNIKLINMIIASLKVLIAVYIVYAGAVFTETIELHRGFGIYFIEAGAGLVMLGLMSGGLVVPAFEYGIKRHNRFVIFMCFWTDTLIMSMLLHLGYTTGQYLIPEYGQEFRTDCIRNVPQIFSVDECRPYLTSDRTAGYRLVWAGFFTDKKDAFQYQIMQTIQDNTGCCGFNPPFRCDNITTGFPDYFASDGISSDFTKYRLLCGVKPNFYPEQDNCADVFDTDDPEQLVGGCRYDLAIGSKCLLDAPQGQTSGCVSSVEDYLGSLISMHVSLIFGVCPLFNLLGMLLACCMWWKRKPESDVFPDFLSEAKFEFSYRNVKDQFELKPTKDLLQKRGYFKPVRGPDEEEGKVPDGAA